MSDYDMRDALKYAMIAVDRLCDMVGKTYFESADPDTEFNWSRISQHTGRKNLYQKVTNWLLEDNHVSLEDKQMALNSVVDNLCAQLERMEWVWSPVVNVDFNAKSGHIQVLHKGETLKSMKSWSPQEIHASEEVDMCMNSGYLFHAAQQWLDIYNDILQNPTPTPKAKM
jgi:hypothetical protein